MTRKAKKPNSIQVSDLKLSGSIVCQTKTANKPSTNSAIHILPLPAGLKSTTLTARYLKTSGAQGRIRTSVAHNAADLQSAAINHSATCAHSAWRTPVHSTQLNPSSPSSTQTAVRSGYTNLEGMTGVCRTRTVSAVQPNPSSLLLRETGAGEG